MTEENFDSTQKAEPERKLEKVSTEIIDPDTRKYTYKMHYTKETPDGDVQKERTITRIYKKKHSDELNRKQATEIVIQKLKTKEYSSVQKAFEDYLAEMKSEYSNLKAYGYNTFGARWHQLNV